MSSASGFFLLVTLVVTLSSTNGYWWDMFDWSTDEPANCPHENHVTHICSSLKEVNATCITFKCCHEFADDDDYADYDESAEPEGDDIFQIGQIFGWCSMCYSIKSCSVSKCYTRCCDGYEPDPYGRCQNKTGHIQCKNGGKVVRDAWNNYLCKCPTDFEGKSCEIPKCHCENGGECVVKDGKPFCNCSHGNYGERCENSECRVDCQNGGQCFRNGTYEMCRCPYNYVGEHCETYFAQPDTCPATTYWSSYSCGVQCTNSDNCKDGKVCCKEGCSTFCREPRVDYCEHGGSRFRIGQTFQPDPCQNCTCTVTGRVICSFMDCAPVTCPYGKQPVRKTGKCCPTCPDKSSTELPVIYGCPDRIVHLNTSLGTDFVILGVNDILPIRAFGFPSYRDLMVDFSPSRVSHCKCHDGQRNRVTSVQAYATDGYGNKATCTFEVVVQDNEPPTFLSCPEDIYVFENEKVHWRSPMYRDNVFVSEKTCTDKKNGQVFPVGNHLITYQIWDYDGNSAVCSFHVSVSSRDTEMAEVPQGLRDRSLDKQVDRLMVIIGPIIGGIVLIAVAVLLYFCCIRKRAANAGRNTPVPGRATPAYDNNIYATPGDITIKLPPYSDLPMNPPAYSITGTEKDVTYMSLAPPSYTNPGYETLKENLQTTERALSAKLETDTKAEEKDVETESTK